MSEAKPLRAVRGLLTAFRYKVKGDLPKAPKNGKPKTAQGVEPCFASTANYKYSAL